MSKINIIAFFFTFFLESVNQMLEVFNWFHDFLKNLLLFCMHFHCTVFFGSCVNSSCLLVIFYFSLIIIFFNLPGYLIVFKNYFFGRILFSLGLLIVRILFCFLTFLCSYSMALFKCYVICLFRILILEVFFNYLVILGAYGRPRCWKDYWMSWPALLIGGLHCAYTV